jgi:soluble lytic murein transglycosylase-like protein
MEANWHRNDIVVAAKTHGLDPNLVEAVVRVESGGLANAYRFEPGFWARYLATDERYRYRNPRRVSASYGLMQVMYSTAVEAGLSVATEPEMLFVPGVSLQYGCAHLASLLAWSKGNVEQALAAYNGGKGGNAKPPYRNRAYVDKVMVAYANVRRERGPHDDEDVRTASAEPAGRGEGGA